MQSSSDGCSMRMQREQAAQRLLDLKAIGRVMDYLRGGGSAHAGLLIMLLSNLTVSEAGSEQLLQLGSAALAGFNVYAAAHCSWVSCMHDHS